MITIGKDGQQVDYYAEKNKEVKAKLKPVLDELLEQKSKDLKGLQKFGFRFAINLDAVLRSYGLMSAEQFARLQYDEIQAMWYGFLDLIAEYNIWVEIIPNKQMFLSYACLNLRQFSQLEKSEDEDIRNLLISLNDFFVGNAFTASESGNSSASAIKQRLVIKDAGHSLVTASDEMIVNALAGETKSPTELMREIERITGGSTPKKLTGK